MKKELTAFDWALCIGQKILYGGEIYKLIVPDRKFLFIHDSECLLYHAAQKFCKPILRSLDQITEEEKEEFNNLFGYPEYGYVFDQLEIRLGSVYFSYNRNRNVECERLVEIDGIDWLTQKGFDIRGWIDAGLAVKYDEVEHG